MGETRTPTEGPLKILVSTTVTKILGQVNPGTHSFLVGEGLQEILGVQSRKGR